MPLSYTCGDILVDSLIEIGVMAPGEPLDAETGAWALRKFNDLCDSWQALGRFVYSHSFSVYTLVAGLSPHTIGPGTSPAATFVTVGPRPVKLESAALMLNNSGTNVDVPMNVRDDDWWAALQTKDIQTNIPTDVYYDPTIENGSLYFWPVPNVARQVRLQLWQTVSQFDAITDPIGGAAGPGTLPQGYRNALKLTLAQLLCPGAAKSASDELKSAGIIARAAIFGNNAKSPRMSTQDAGMPKAGRQAGRKGDFNWLTGGAPGGAPE